jgi:hypothetical protein
VAQDGSKFVYRKAAGQAAEEGLEAIGSAATDAARRALRASRGKSEKEFESLFAEEIEKILAYDWAGWAVRRAQEIGEEWDAEAEKIERQIEDLENENPAGSPPASKKRKEEE